MLTKLMRLIGIITLILTLAMHFLGGIGTTCVAFAAEKYDAMSGIVPYKTLYQAFVLLTLAISVYGIFATTAYLRRRPRGYWQVIAFLTVALVLSGVHMATSLQLRGAAAPVNVRVYLNALTLLIWLLFLLPGWRAQLVEGSLPGSSTSASGAALIAAGLLVLSVHSWAAPSHVMNGGINYADAFHLPLTILGWMLNLAGVSLLARTWNHAQRFARPMPEAQESY